MEPTSMFRGTGLRNDESNERGRDPLNRYNVTLDFRFNDSTWRGQSPQPHAQNSGDDQCDPA